MCFLFPESLSGHNCTVLATDALSVDHEVCPLMLFVFVVKVRSFNKKIFVKLIHYR